MNALFDHLWQSLQVIGCLAVFAWLTRGNSARFRLWVWRIAIAKLLVPLAALRTLGAWFGFPMAHSAEPTPEMLVRWMDRIDAWLSPAANLASVARWLLLVGLVAITVVAVRLILRALRDDALLAAEEIRRLELDPDDRPPGVGFLASLLMSAWAAMLLTVPLLTGAIEDRERRQVLLRHNERALKDARVVMKPAEAGMGSRVRVVADEHGVTIRNATLQEIGGIAYGVSVHLVRGQHFMSDGERNDWLIGSRHDVRVIGPVLEPGEFDTYALREPLTKALALQFGLEIYQNGKCQPPCGRWGSLVLPEAARQTAQPAVD